MAGFDVHHVGQIEDERARIEALRTELGADPVIDEEAWRDMVHSLACFGAGTLMEPETQRNTLALLGARILVSLPARRQIRIEGIELPTTAAGVIFKKMKRLAIE